MTKSPFMSVTVVLADGMEATADMWPDDVELFLDSVVTNESCTKFHKIKAIDGSEIVIEKSSIRLIHKYPSTTDDVEDEYYDE